MKCIILLLLLGSAMSSVKVFDNLYGEYRIYFQDSMNYKILKVFKNGSFYYEEGGDLALNAASGVWAIIKDTLVLNSDFQENGFVVEMKKIRSRPNGAELLFYNKEKERIKPEAIVLFRDTIQYQSLMRSHEIVSFSGVDSFKMVLSSNLISKACPVYDTSGKFEVFFPKAEVYPNYIFLKNSKMLIRENGLYVVTNNKIDSTVANYATRIPVWLKKTKTY